MEILCADEFGVSSAGFNKNFLLCETDKHSPPPCKTDTGEVKCSESGFRRDKVMKHCDPCECKHSPNDLPASSPELNPAELAQNHLKYHVLPELMREEGIEWKGNADDKMAILTRAIQKFDADKEWFKKTFASLRKRYKWIADNDGEIYRK